MLTAFPVTDVTVVRDSASLPKSLVKAVVNCMPGWGMNSPARSSAIATVDTIRPTQSDVIAGSGDQTKHSFLLERIEFARA